MTTTRAMTDDWPSHTEELTRKTLSALEDVLRRRDAGEITEREAWFAIGVMFDCVSGLVDREVMDVLTQARDEIKPVSGQERRWFARKGEEGLEIVLLQRALDAPLVKRWVGRLPKGSRKIFGNMGAAHDFFEETSAALEKHGFGVLR